MMQYQCQSIYRARFSLVKVKSASGPLGHVLHIGIYKGGFAPRQVARGVKSSWPIYLLPILGTYG